MANTEDETSPLTPAVNLPATGNSIQDNSQLLIAESSGQNSTMETVPSIERPTSLLESLAEIPLLSDLVVLTTGSNTGAASNNPDCGGDGMKVDAQRSPQVGTSRPRRDTDSSSHGSPPRKTPRMDVLHLESSMLAIGDSDLAPAPVPAKNIRRSARNEPGGNKDPKSVWQSK